MARTAGQIRTGASRAGDSSAAIAELHASLELEGSEAGVAPPPAASPAGGTVLLAADNEVNRQVTVSMLEILGYRVESVENGRDAVERFRAGGIDLVLLDCQMPVMDGFAAAEAIRRLPSGSDRPVPLIAVTASALREERERCLAVGVQDFLRKPFTLDDLQRVLDRWLPGRAPAPAPAVEAAAAGSGADPGTELDRNAIEGLRVLESRGRTGLVEGIVQTWLANTAQHVEGMRLALGRKAYEEVRRMAHGLKSASAFVGAIAVRECALALENAAKSASPDCARLLHELNLAFGRVRPLLEAAVRRDAA